MEIEMTLDEALLQLSELSAQVRLAPENPEAWAMIYALTEAFKTVFPDKKPPIKVKIPSV